VQGGTYIRSNISYVPKNLHDLWSALFPGTMTARQIIREINNIWIDPDYRIVLFRKTAKTN
jgi:hypothetical protein